MGTTDIDVIKEIPGYKVILKAVVKSQIQQLVEQLAEHTNEESVILTASVADGTISHIGSESGKSFLQDNDDFKSQFLGFCLKYHHRKQMEKEKEKAEKEERERQELLQQQQQQQQMMQQQLAFSQPPRFSRSPRQFSPRFPSPRHQPYPSGRPPRRPPAPNFGPGQGVQGLAMPGARNVKVEPSDSDEASNQSGTDAGNVKHETTGSVQESGANTDNENRDSDGSNLAAGDQGGEQQGSGSGPQTPGSDPDINVKLEALTEEELDLEITGVEPGTAGAGMSQSEWDPNASLGMDYGQGATGSSADMQGQAGYTQATARNYKHFCQICGRPFRFNWQVVRHMRIHTGEKPFECNVCFKRFNVKSNLRAHMVHHMATVSDGFQMGFIKDGDNSK
ncbi:transcriptional repressor scratch 2-like isoform X11 [Mya arenaria]|uniref:transcriptional repressor scratch 2-like isoform X11 n=1 Tax=Mya arenaria TaxID=6604 RepID=UPI0022E93B9A|nr:transcriptional repressor scratch 2-like isoform X11 [Mya arenaria]